MDVRCILAIAVAVAVAESPVGAQAPTTDGVAWLRAQRTAVTSSENSYSGPGWDKMLAEGGDSQFFMIGEQHASGSIADLETAIHAALAPYGYDHAALEVGPYAATLAERLIRSRPGALADYLKVPGQGFSIPFIFMTGDLKMAEQIVANSSDRGRVLWGVDQEFIASASVVADFLAERAKSPAQRAAVAQWRKDAKADPFLLGNGDESTLVGIESAFAGNNDVGALLAEIRSSRAIYRPFLGKGGSGYMSNLARETGMKRQFQRQFDAATKRLGKPPRVFFKFGGFHAMRGISGTNVPAFANFLAEWGGSKGLGMVNVMVDCLGGTALNALSGKAEPCKSYFGKDAAIVRASADGSPIQIYDFKALRPTLARQKDLDPETARAILAFDYYVVVRDGVAATAVGDLSGK